MPADAFWVFSPQFKKILALAIGEQFGTSITTLSASRATTGTRGCSWTRYAPGGW